MLFKASSALAAVLGFTLSQPVLSHEIMGSSAELAEQDGHCIFHFKDWPNPGCTGTQTKGGVETKEKIGKVKDGKCVTDANTNAALMYVDYCDSDDGAGIYYGFGGGDEGMLMASNNTVIPLGVEIGNKAVYNGKKWDVTKK